MRKMLDRSEAIARGDSPPPPIAQLIGFDLTVTGRRALTDREMERHNAFYIGGQQPKDNPLNCRARISVRDMIY